MYGITPAAVTASRVRWTDTIKFEITLHCKSMLEIFTDGEKTDLQPDTEIELTFEQPMIADDRIPAPYSFDYELPLTPRNRRLFGYPDRTASDRMFEKIPSEIVFGGVVVARGTQRIA